MVSSGHRSEISDSTKGGNFVMNSAVIYTQHSLQCLPYITVYGVESYDAWQMINLNEF